MSPEAQAELVEKEVGAGWAETREWSERVIELRQWSAPQIDDLPPSGTDWLPDSFDSELGELLGLIPDEDVSNIVDEVRAALNARRALIETEYGTIPATGKVEQALSRRLDGIRKGSDPKPPAGPVEAVLPVTHDNFWELDFLAPVRARDSMDEFHVPLGLGPLLFISMVDEINQK